VSYTLYRLHMT